MKGRTNGARAADVLMTIQLPRLDKQTEAREAIEKAIQTLINTRHLYQSVEVDFRPVIKGVVWEICARRNADKPGSARSEDVEIELLVPFGKTDWVFGPDVPGTGKLYFSLPPVRTLCSTCDSVEPFDILNEFPLAHTMPISLGFLGQQVFVWPLKCQGCRSKVMVFMVSRSGLKIQLVGRSEFEEIKAPDYVNKRERKFYSDAVIAFNCGQVLPAIFMLRTLVEQHMGRVTGCSDINVRGDALCDLYNGKLAEDFVARFPSFKVIYGKLSAVSIAPALMNPCSSPNFKTSAFIFRG